MNIMKRDMRTIKHTVMPLLQLRLLTDTTKICTFKKLQELVTAKNRHQNVWFATGRSSYKQKLAHKLKKVINFSISYEQHLKS
jgi:hypothetical protein